MNKSYGPVESQPKRGPSPKKPMYDFGRDSDFEDMQKLSPGRMSRAQHMELNPVRNHRTIDLQGPPSNAMPVRKAGGPKYSVPQPQMEDSFEDEQKWENIQN